MEENHQRLKKLHQLMRDLGFSWSGNKKIGGVIDVIDSQLQSKVSETKENPKCSI